MIDRFEREIDALRISVTDRCNLRCTYCMPATGVKLVRHEDILRFEEIVEVARVALEMGIHRFRLTGGEPLVRHGIVELVRQLAALPGITDLAMTTNGVLLEKFASDLAAEGLRRVNISLDALDPDRFAAITRGGDVHAVLAGIAAARQAGLRPVKLNCVTDGEASASDAAAVKAFAAREGLEVRFIRQMNLAAGTFGVVDGGHGGDCAHCDRLRLTADGHVKPCLFSNLRFSVRALGPRAALEQALAAKPAAGSVCTNQLMHSIGG
jgi:cyclic pyranopterin phosphate synthase